MAGDCNQVAELIMHVKFQCWSLLAGCCHADLVFMRRVFVMRSLLVCSTGMRCEGAVAIR